MKKVTTTTAKTYYVYNIDTKALLLTTDNENEAVQFCTKEVVKIKKSKTTINQSFRNALKGYKGYGFFKEYFVSLNKLSRKDFWSIKKQTEHFKEFINANYTSIVSKVTSMTARTLGNFDDMIFTDTVVYAYKLMIEAKGINDITETLSCKYRFNMLDKFKKKKREAENNIIEDTFDFDKLTDDISRGDIYSNVMSMKDNSSAREHAIIEMKGNLLIKTIQEKMIESSNYTAFDIQCRTKIFDLVYKECPFILDAYKKYKIALTTDTTTSKRINLNGLVIKLPLALTNDEVLMDYIEDLQKRVIINCRLTPVNQVIYGICFDVLGFAIANEDELREQLNVELDNFNDTRDEYKEFNELTLNDFINN